MTDTPSSPVSDDGTPVDDTDARETGALEPDFPALVGALQAELEAVRDQTLRAIADGENVRRRAEREKAEARAYAVERFARDLLSVADNLDRALATAPEGLKGDPGYDGFLTGIEMTGRELASVFERHNLTRVGAPGDRFDPALHQAVAQIPADMPAGDIAQVFQPGYVLSGRTIRAAMVAVSAGPAAG